MKIALVCLGNICRSPMAGVVLEHRLREAGVDAEVVSAGTADYHVGQPMHEPAARTLRSAGYDPSRHVAKRFSASWFSDCDLVLAMDAANHDALEALAGDDPETAQALPDKLRMFRSFDPAGPGDVPDPYYGDDAAYREVLDIVERTAPMIVDEIRRAGAT